MLAVSSFSQTLVLFLICAAFLYYGGKGLMTGKVNTRNGHYDRNDSPFVYWAFTMLFLTFGLLLVILLIVQLLA